MRILVIGRSGQLGTALAEATSAGVTVVAVGRPDADLTRPEALAEMIARERPAAVINAAAYTAVDRAESEAEAAFALNATGAGNVASAAHAAGLPVVHVSTDYVFDGSKSEPYLETDPVAPLGVYGASKLDGERRVAQANPRHLIVRTAWVVSPFGANFVKTMLRLAAERPRLRVVDDQIGTPTYAPDLARALIAMAGQGAQHPAGDVLWGVYHAANGGETTWCGLARRVMERARSRGLPSAPVDAIMTADYPTPARRPANSRLDTGKLTRVFGLSLPHWTQAVDACVDRLAAVNTDAKR